MPNNFEIIMQLHGEGEQPAPAAAPEGGGTEAAVDTGSADTASAPAQDAEPAGKRYAIEVDPRTQRRKIVLLGNKEENMQEQPAQEEPAPAASTAAPQAEVKQEEQPLKAPEQPLFPQAQQQVLNTEPYKTVAEVVEAIRSNTIDPRRVPLEYAGQVAQLRNAMQAQMQNQAQPAKPVVPQEQARNDFYMKVEQAARENALKAVGITEEELESADYSDDAGLKQRVKQFEAALAWQRNSIVEGVRQRQLQAMQQQQAQRQIYADIDNKVAEYRQNEPEFEGINVLMAGLYKTMPYEQASKYAGAIIAYQQGNITQQQAQALQEYYDEARKVYYAQKNGLNVIPAPTPAPPKVEQPGSGVQQTAHTSIDDLRKARSNYKNARSIIGKIVAERQQRR